MPTNMQNAKTISIETLASGPNKRFLKEQLELDDGARIEWYFMDTPASAMVVPLTREGSCVCIQQYRHNLRSRTIELPAGIIGPDESPEEAALRELSEETGYILNRQEDIEPLGAFYSLPSETNRVIHYFLARNVELNNQPLGDAEIEEYFDMEVVVLPFSQSLESIGKEIRGSETAFALMLTMQHLGSKLL